MVCKLTRSKLFASCVIVKDTYAVEVHANAEPQAIERDERPPRMRGSRSSSSTESAKRSVRTRVTNLVSSAYNSMKGSWRRPRDSD